MSTRLDATEALVDKLSAKLDALIGTSDRLSSELDRLKHKTNLSETERTRLNDLERELKERGVGRLDDALDARLDAFTVDLGNSQKWLAARAKAGKIGDEVYKLSLEYRAGKIKFEVLQAKKKELTSAEEDWDRVGQEEMKRLRQEEAERLRGIRRSQQSRQGSLF